jgi:hypothetical protein
LNNSNNAERKKFWPLASIEYSVERVSFPPDLPGDVNYDGIVDMRDVASVARLFGKNLSHHFYTDSLLNKLRVSSAK